MPIGDETEKIFVVGFSVCLITELRALRLRVFFPCALPTVGGDVWGGGDESMRGTSPRRLPRRFPTWSVCLDTYCSNGVPHNICTAPVVYYQLFFFLKNFF